ncbi:hypothetical protein [Maridesulfovibrio ferrireducens]|uniref:hypothetical protein n=1 Tax=Maridesulfovibrio ferrireducens TaxID=246191 RepID=UPI001A1A52B3|nr:hypothetical protein [Maridesulfovibrio ferrireducens]MBI9109884.1 hypothetical protein [Maridesulfovibrio ferrireducens]
MRNRIIKHIRYIEEKTGSYSSSARLLGIDPRTYRNQRKDLKMTRSARRAIILAAKYLRLKITLRILREDYGVPIEDIRAACKQARTI